MYKNAVEFNFKSAIFIILHFLVNLLVILIVLNNIFQILNFFINDYLKKPRKYDSKINYIRKKSPLRKKSTNKTTVSNFVDKAIENKIKKNEKNKNEKKK